MQKHKLIPFTIIAIIAVGIIFACGIYGTELKGPGERISNILTATIAVKKVTPPPSGGGGTYIPGPITPTPPPPLPPIIIPKPIPTFTDITGHWAGHNIRTLAGMGIVAGYPDGTFKPNANITRAEFVAMLVRALGLEQDAAAASAFTDVFGWTRGAIGAAHKAGLIFGYADGTFGPSQQITRAEVAVILSRVIYKALMPVTLTDVAEFADVATIPAWAKDAVRTTARGGLIRGYPDNTFRAGNMTTRAEVATMLYRLVVQK